MAEEWTIGKLLQWTTDYLKQHGSESPRLEAEVLEYRSYEGANAGLALIRDGNGTRSFETLLRYRGAAMAEFWRALKTLKALQAEQGRENDAALAIEAGRAVAHRANAAAPAPLAAPPQRPAARPNRARPNEPARPSARAARTPPARQRGRAARRSPTDGAAPRWQNQRRAARAAW